MDAIHTAMLSHAIKSGLTLLPKRELKMIPCLSLE